MAQQARPKVAGHIERVRAQLIPLLEGGEQDVGGPGGLRPSGGLLHLGGDHAAVAVTPRDVPVECAPPPDVDQGLEQQQGEDADGRHARPAELSKRTAQANRKTISMSKITNSIATR